MDSVLSSTRPHGEESCRIKGDEVFGRDRHAFMFQVQDFNYNRKFVMLRQQVSDAFIEARREFL